MKKLLSLVILLAFIFSCKNKEASKIIENKLSIAQKIANANGFEHWKNVSQLHFTFNVDKDSTHTERSWIWKPKTGDVILISGQDTITYNRKLVDSLTINADKSFINDKFWLLAPFQLVWDSSTQITEPVLEKAPMSKNLLNKIVLTYLNDHGYTPGDGYDFYFDDDFIIKEWVFRRGNSIEPTMITSWESYQDFNGIKIALEHKKLNENWNLNFTNVKVEMN